MAGLTLGVGLLVMPGRFALARDGASQKTSVVDPPAVDEATYRALMAEEAKTENPAAAAQAATPTASLTRKQGKDIMRGVGLSAAVIGAVTWGLTDFVERCGPILGPDSGCRPEDPHRTYWGPDIAMASGLALFVISYWIPDEAPAAAEGQRSARAPSFNLAAAPTAGGGQVSLSGRF